MFNKYDMVSESNHCYLKYTNHKHIHKKLQILLIFLTKLFVVHFYEKKTQKAEFIKDVNFSFLLEAEECSSKQSVNDIGCKLNCAPKTCTLIP